MIVDFSSKDYVIEPANVHILKYVTSVNIANVPRLKVRSPKDCGNENSDVIVGNYAVINNRGMKGDVELVEGWNCSIATSENTLVVSAVNGGGKSLYEKQPSEVAVTPAEELELAQGKYLSGGPRCKDLVSSINGIKGPLVSLYGGPGVSVTSNGNTLDIKIVSTSGDGDCEPAECVVRSIDKYSNKSSSKGQ